MWVVRLVFFLLLLFLLVYIFAANAGQTVDLNFLKYEFLDLNLFWVVAVSFALGFLAAFVGMSLREWRHRREIGHLKRHSRNMNKELTDLRNIPLQELSEGGSSKDD